MRKKKSTSASATANIKTTKAENKKEAKGGDVLPIRSTQKPSTGKGVVENNNTTTQNSSNGGPKPTPKNKNKRIKTSEKGRGK